MLLWGQRQDCYTNLIMGWDTYFLETRNRPHGFTLVELLIVMAVLSILAALTAVAYNGVQQQARDAQLKSNISDIQKMVQLYHGENGGFPVTTNNPKSNWRAADARTDSNCTNGSSQADWIPGISSTLPKSDANSTGVNGLKGCYVYVSDGLDYVISAWNMVESPQTAAFYRRIGFREFQSDSSTQFYTCNVSNIGGVSGGKYTATQDYYKHSYTVSSITSCDETPPAGA